MYLNIALAFVAIALWCMWLAWEKRRADRKADLLRRRP